MRYQVDVDLDDIPTEDLVEAVNGRLLKVGLGKALNALNEVYGIPESVLQPVREWAKQKELTGIDLKRWKEFCGVQE
jgi:hypothetical protein